MSNRQDHNEALDRVDTKIGILLAFLSASAWVWVAQFQANDGREILFARIGGVTTLAGVLLCLLCIPFGGFARHSSTRLQIRAALLSVAAFAGIGSTVMMAAIFAIRNGLIAW